MVRRTWLVIVVSVIGAMVLLMFTLWMWRGWGGKDVTTAVDDIGALVFAGFATICCLLAARRSVGRLRATWLALGAGLGAWTVGDALWTYYEVLLGKTNPFPSPADAGYLLFPVGAALALVFFPRGHRHDSRTRLLLDGVLVAGSLFVVSWVTALGSAYKAGGDSHFAFGVSLAYPITDLVILTMTVLVLVRATTTHRLTLALIAFGMALMALSDSAFGYLIATNHYGTANLVDAGWPAAFLLFAVAALSSTDEPAVGVRTASAVPRSRIWLPYLPLLLAGGIGIRLVVPALRSGPVPAVAVLLVLVVLFRQFLTVAENRRLLTAVAHQAFHDPLTGLANRALFTDRLDHAVQLHRRDLGPLSLLSLDLDDFKLVNDSLGHPAGDDLLVRVAERLLGCLRSSDTVARLGGDEFAVLIEEGADRPLLVADRVVEAFSAPFVIEGHSLAVRPTIGLASASADTAEVSAETLLKQADVAMYAGKRGGAGGVHMFRPDMHLADLDELSLRQDLTRAVARGEIDIAYQPIVDVATGALRGAEALARWHHPDHGQIPPLRFIPMAEQAGLITQLGLHVLDKALAEFAGWAQPDGASPLRLAVNLSAQQLTDPEFPAQAKALLDRHKVPASQLILEITEGVLLTHVEAAGTVAAALDTLGVQLALDDFGVGFSSLAHLTRFPLHILKIDRAFVDPLDTEPDQRDFFAALLQLGRSIHLEIVAEGVERPAQLVELQTLGCDLAQGYHLGRPTDGATIRQSLETRSDIVRIETGPNQPSTGRRSGRRHTAAK